MSDGALLPSELVRRVEVLDYEAVALTDHVDQSNIDSVVPALVRVAAELNGNQSVKVVPGAELTHVPPPLIGGMVARARELGAKVVVVHGQTIVEPVAPGANRAGIEAGCDLLAHPGLITPEEVQLAAERGVLLELSARKGHNIANGHVARLGLAYGAGLVVNSDAHDPSDLMTAQLARQVALGAGLDESQATAALERSRSLVANL